MKWAANGLLVAAFILCSTAGHALEGTVKTLSEAKVEVQQQPDKHILVFYKNYRN